MEGNDIFVDIMFSVILAKHFQTYDIGKKATGVVACDQKGNSVLKPNLISSIYPSINSSK